jgi:hypothetical protein
VISTQIITSTAMYKPYYLVSLNVIEPLTHLGGPLHYALHDQFLYKWSHKTSAWRTSRNSVQYPGSSTADYTLWGLAPALSSPVEPPSCRASLIGPLVQKLVVQGIIVENSPESRYSEVFSFLSVNRHSYHSTNS